MQITTVLGRVMTGKWSPNIMNIYTLIILPRETLRVYQGDLKEQEFKDLKTQAAFITLLQNEQQLPSIKSVIKPFTITNYQNKV